MTGRSSFLSDRRSSRHLPRRVPMLVLGRILFGYAITGFGAYLMVIDVRPFTAAPFFTGAIVLMIGTGIAHPAQAIPILGYCVSAASKLAFWRRGESQPVHEHRRRSDAEPHHHKRHTPTRKRLSIGEFTISQPMIPDDDVGTHHNHHRHHKRSDD